MDTSKYIPLSNKMKDITGQRFGRLVALGPVGQAKSSAVIWRFACDCGNHTEVPSGRAISGNTRSCGCMSVSGKKTDRTYHGMKGTKEYNAWCNIKSRCTNQNNPSFHNYGGRGITVCDRWFDSFENFCADMGPSPSPIHSIDRIDNDGQYSPENCRWASSQEQSNNTRRNNHVDIDGERMTLGQAAERYGINRTTLSHRINRQGLTIKEALVSPPIPTKYPIVRKNSVVINHSGESLTIAEWSRRTGISHSTLLCRYNKDWSPERILTTPV